MGAGNLATPADRIKDGFGLVGVVAIATSCCIGCNSIGSRGAGGSSLQFLNAVLV